MTIGQRIQLARKESKLSQKELGEKLGVSGSMVGQYESDLRNPKLVTLQRIADALGVDVNWLCTGRTTEQQNQTQSASQNYDDTLELLAFLNLSPEDTLVVQRGYAMLRRSVKNICSEAAKDEPDLDYIIMMAQGLSAMVDNTKRLIPDEFSEMKQRYEDKMRQDRDYEEFLAKYKRLLTKGRREAEKYMDYLIFCQERKQNDRKE